ncbi:hypothetical protein Nepgr_005071 [Nepenthes gracilis]|uniref:Uncharacterized protein n=1 Tax=Nepenthes gracilis TaxID=150966 RepID=A0AAD3S2I2_NEPGR|nr:hypothetical protein Nepgr_005071 [Nepenthes gracilis]
MFEDHDVDVLTFDDVESKMAMFEARITTKETSPNSASRIAIEVERLRRQLVELKANCCLALTPLQLPSCSQAARGYVPDEVSAGCEAAAQDVRFHGIAEPPSSP